MHIETLIKHITEGAKIYTYLNVGDAKNYKPIAIALDASHLLLTVLKHGETKVNASLDSSGDIILKDVEYTG